jgi:hypothetical protein
MQELLLVGLIDLVAAGMASLPFWLLLGLRRRCAAASPVRGEPAGRRWPAREVRVREA